MWGRSAHDALASACTLFHLSSYKGGRLEPGDEALSSSSLPADQRYLSLFKPAFCLFLVLFSSDGSFWKELSDGTAVSETSTICSVLRTS